VDPHPERRYVPVPLRPPPDDDARALHGRLGLARLSVECGSSQRRLAEEATMAEKKPAKESAGSSKGFSAE
jgi:hypothetical protein